MKRAARALESSVKRAAGAGVPGRGGRVAGFFEGNVEVTGDIRLVNADCAEDFDVRETTEDEPGTVMVLGAEAILQASEYRWMRAMDRFESAIC